MYIVREEIFCEEGNHSINLFIDIIADNDRQHNAWAVPVHGVHLAVGMTTIAVHPAACFSALAILEF